MLAGLAVGLIVAGYLGVRFFVLARGQGNELSSAAGLTPRNVEGTAGGPGTPEYNALIEELNRSGARAAREKGQSFVDTPVGEKIPAQWETQTKDGPAREERKESSVPMAPQPMAKEVSPPKKPERDPARDSGLVQAMVGDLRGLGPKDPGAFVISLNRDNGLPVGPRQSPELDSGDGAAPAPIPALGSVLYAVTELAVNSDVPAPVMARVIGGELAGTKFLGGFGRHGENVTLTFTRMIAPDGSSRSVEALAVDPKTASPAIGANVDRHLLARWGGLLAASFLEGFGGALSDRGTRVSVYGDVVVEGKDYVDFGEISLEALGQVGSRAANQLEKNFDRPPTMKIPAGSQIGLLILGLKD
jgi:type IV secretory pathway VirB10-like protein